MDFSLLITLLKNLLHVDVLLIRNEEDLAQIEAFSSKYCYNPTLQPLFTSQELFRYASLNTPDTMYRLRDSIGISINVLHFNGVSFLIGPYVTHEFHKPNVESILSRAGFSVSTLASLQLYYSSMPLISSTRLYETITACLKSIDTRLFELRMLTISTDEISETSQPTSQEDYDYSVIYQRYKLENNFLNAIESGDVERLFEAYHDMNARGLDKQRYVNAIYQDPIVGLSIIRTLARKAAERAGASVLEINEITQRATQQLLSAHSFHEMETANLQMLKELTLCVKRRRESFANISPPIRKAIDYIQQNLGQNIQLGRLAEQTELSSSYLSALFKKETGSTISEYIASKRCQEAASLLSNSDIPIQDIATLVGYWDNNYFVKVFKKQYKKTPSDYRKDTQRGQ